MGKMPPADEKAKQHHKRNRKHATYFLDIYIRQHLNAFCQNDSNECNGNLRFQRELLTTYSVEVGAS